MKIGRFEDVVAWQKARELTIALHKEFSHCKDRDFRSQIYRASLSVMNNIAEGFDRGADKELRYFLIIARGSAAEVRSMLLIAPELGYLDEVKQPELLELANTVSKLIYGFTKILSSQK